MTPPDRFFSDTILGGRLHVRDIPHWEPWNSNRINRFPENQIVIVPKVGDRMIRTREELEAIIRVSTPVTPTRNIWIHESLEDEARDGCGRREPGRSREDERAESRKACLSKNVVGT
jgi:hypothetical protein